jgi:hypothetical protein
MRRHLAFTSYILPLRSCLIAIGCIAMWWGIVEFPAFWRETTAKGIAGRIVAGDPFKADVLTRQVFILSDVERSAYCYPDALRNAAIIELRAVEVAEAAGDRSQQRLDKLHTAILNSLSCAPADPFLWLALYWLESTKNDFRPNALQYLQMSYRLGPNEGWIALKRNPLAFVRFQQLPPDLAKEVVDEFISLVQTGLIPQAVDIFSGPAWPERDLILSRFENVADKDRKLFADTLYDHGIDVNVPGIEPRHSN